MPDPNGFLRFDRRTPPRRPVAVRVNDWLEVYEPAGVDLAAQQATRCMDCGVPFCHRACPLGNRIPDFNDAVRAGNWAAASEVLHATNNFPEFTGRLCPAPCEAACVLAITDGDRAVTIKAVESEIIDQAFGRGHVVAWPAPVPSGRRVAVVGSGPAGLAAAQQLARAGHAVTVYERDDAIGGLLRYGIPDFKLDKGLIDRRLGQLVAEGVEFITGCTVGVDITAAELRQRHDAVLLACGALAGRDMPDVAGRELAGIHLAMPHLVGANRRVAAMTAGGPVPALAIDAAGKDVVIIGGGDTAADCLGVAHRQGARSVTQLDMYPAPPSTRDTQRDPWPAWPWILRDYAAHEEGGQRRFAVAVREFLGDANGQLRAVRIVQVSVTRTQRGRTVTEIPGTERELPAQLVLLAIGFSGTEQAPLLHQFGLPLREAGTVDCGADWRTGADGVFVAGDMHRGASLVVWAIAEGRSAAAAIHRYLGGSGALPEPVSVSATALSG